METRKIEEVVLDQLANFEQKDSGLKRLVDFKKYLTTKQIVVISGIRRSGKSTLLKQLADELKNFYYINFDDERLIDFKVSDFNDLLAVWQKQGSSKNILIDEIQNVDKWERFVRRIHEEGYKVFITGSNAKLLSSELATHLTGRYVKIELYPFSFKEFLLFQQTKISELTTKNKARILKAFDNYLWGGGFPEYLQYQDEEFLKRTYEDIIYKDIISRFGIREIKTFRQLANYLFTNFAKETSYNSLKNILNIKTVVTVKDYISFLQESYLLFELFKYDYSLKKQYVSNKKIYVIDNGLRNKTAFSFSADCGRLLENLVFIELKRRQNEVYYFKHKTECDFIISAKNKITQAIQVTDSLDADNKKREIDGLMEAMEQFKLKAGLILTANQSARYVIEKKVIDVKPIWQWLIE